MEEKKMIIEVFGDRILLEYAKEENKEMEKSKGGIYMPKTNDQEERNLWSKVVYIGGKVENVKVGREVLFDKYITTPIKIDGEAYFIIREQDVIATRR